MELKDVVMKKFLRKLMNLNIWGGRHTELKNLQKALPAHLRGGKEMKKAIKELINLEFLLIKPSTGELHVSLNPHKSKEIYDLKNNQLIGIERKLAMKNIIALPFFNFFKGAYWGYTNETIFSADIEDQIFK